MRRRLGFAAAAFIRPINTIVIQQCPVDSETVKLLVDLLFQARNTRAHSSLTAAAPAERQGGAARCSLGACAGADDAELR